MTECVCEALSLGFAARDCVGEDLLAACLLERVLLESKDLFVSRNAGVSDEHTFPLEDRQLAGLLLFLSLEVEAQNRLVHDAGKKGHLLYFFFLGHSAQFILECYRDSGLEEPFLLLATHVTNIPKLKKIAKFWYFDFGTAFGSLFRVQTPGFWGVCKCSENEPAC